MKYIKRFESIFDKEYKGVYYWFENEILDLKSIGFNPKNTPEETSTFIKGDVSISKIATAYRGHEDYFYKIVRPKESIFKNGTSSHRSFTEAFSELKK